MTAQAYFGGAGGAHGTAGVTTQSTGAPADSIIAIATEVGSQCDVFFGDLNSPNCSSFQFGSLSCSIGGLLWSLLQGLPSMSTVKGGRATTGASFIPGTGVPDPAEPLEFVLCGVSNHCTVATTPPLCDVVSPIHAFNLMGADPNQICASRKYWKETIPYIHFPSTNETICSPWGLKNVDILGPATPPLDCTTTP